MDLVMGMDVGAEIEVTEDGDLEELPLHLENVQNCLCLESVDISSSDDDGESHLTFFLPVRRPPRPAQRRSIHRPTAAAKLSASQKWIPPLFPCPLRPGGPSPAGIPAFGAYQCQKCLQVFMEEWHYTQHLQDHAQEEEQLAQLHAAQHPARPPSPPRKLRCLECGKRFLQPEQFARHTKWHLKLVRLGIKVHHRKASWRSSQVSYVYQPLGGTRNPLEGNDGADLPVVQEILSQPAGLQVPKPPRTGRRKAVKHQKRKSAERWQPQELFSSTQAGNSMAVLDGATGVHLLQPWQKQEGVLEGQVAGGLFQPTVMSAENQIIILDGDEAEAVPVAPERHYTELQTTVFDSQGTTDAMQPVFLRTEEPAVVLDPPAGTSPLQAGGVKDQAAVVPGWGGQNPCTVYRTVLLQAEDQAAVVDGQTEPGPFQQVIIKTSEVSPTFYLDPQISSLDPTAFHLVPEPQYVTFPYGNSLPLDHSEATEEGEKAWESQAASFCLPSLYQANKQQPSPVATASPKSPVVVRLLPCPEGDHPEVLDLEYDTGGGIPVASEPWDVNLQAEQETPSLKASSDDAFIVVEMESETGQQGMVVSEHHHRPRPRTFRRGRKLPPRNSSIWRFKCPDCGVCYSQLSQLRSHQKGRKRRGRRFLCECGSSFRGLLHLLRHQLQHLEEALFICSTCGKSLQGHAGLQRHNTCNPGLAHFSCPCGEHFQRLSRYLWHHVRSQRPGLRVYTLAGFLSSP
ncbi:uncharacterized protein LOC120298723 [Crotalus tigris]|uniref:uncharacterized protein LOC120298723 n=1 Tax=Crotalus tigris TaxID=88082 RepID=UPI00192F7A0D|nr:uncharacterized protein LOC120298723 [Crotalus tigris]XP_039178646.1 uncharacterized protein LOC120298723 [Crotalus tigris]